MRRLFVLTAILILSSAAIFAQSVEDVFKQKFPRLGTELDFKPDAELSKEQVANYRSQYFDLEKARKDIQMQKLLVADESSVKVFDLKELKSLAKNEQLDAIDSLLVENHKNIRSYLRDKTKYGADSIECLENLSILKTLTDQKDYDAAYRPFKLLFQDYPISSTNIYKKGEVILSYKMKEAHKKAVAESKKGEKADNDLIMKYIQEERQWFDTLQMMYDQRIKYFGNSKKYGKGYILGKKGLSYYKGYKKVTLDTSKVSPLDTAYMYMKESVKLEMGGSSHKVIMSYFSSGIDMLREKKIGTEDIIEDYILADNAINAKIAESEAFVDKFIDSKNPKKQRTAQKLQDKAIPGYKKISDKITEVFIKCPCSSCEVLDSLFSAKFEENKKNIEWLQKSTGLLQKKGCKDSQFYEDGIVAIYDSIPSAKAAFDLAQFYLRKENYEKAASYYEEAYTQETDSLLKAKYLYGGAVLARIQNKYGKARTLALQAASLRANWGEPYILIGRMYAASAGSCGSDAFEKLSTYWAAADKMIYARSIDKSEEVQKDAGKYLSSYSSKFPKQEDGFMREVYEGNSVKIGCWINETTKARYNK